MLLEAIEAATSQVGRTRRPHFRLKAEMARKGLTVRAVSRLAHVCYTSTSSVLNGSLVQPQNFEKIIAAIESAPLPEQTGNVEITREEFHQQMCETLSRRAGQKLTLTIIDQA